MMMALVYPAEAVMAQEHKKLKLIKIVLNEKKLRELAWRRKVFPQTVEKSPFPARDGCGCCVYLILSGANV